MIRMLVDRLLFVLLACAVWLAIVEQFNPHPPQLLVQANEKGIS